MLFNAIALMLALALAGRINPLIDIWRPLGVVLGAALINFFVSFVLDGLAWGIPELLIAIVVTYILIGYVFTFTRRRRLLVVGTYFGICIAFEVALHLLAEPASPIADAAPTVYRPQGG